MPLRFLIGPVGPTLPASHWKPLRDRDLVRTFGPDPDADFASVPPVHGCDVVCLWLGDTTIPDACWSLGLPVVAIVPDWNLQWHAQRHILPHVAALFTDRAGVVVSAAAGFGPAYEANLFGWPKAIPAWDASPERDIDVLFVGNMSPSVQRERLTWLGRLAANSNRWNVVIRTQVFGDEYTALLRRSKVVFNRSARGECNLRVGEAIAHGAVLLQEAENVEIVRYLRPEVEYVSYSTTDLEERIAALLAHPERRQAIAHAAYQRLPQLTFTHLVETEVFAVLEREWATLRTRITAPPVWSLPARAWSYRTSRGPAPVAPTGYVEADDANALGAACDEPPKALAWFEQALREEPTRLVAGLNRVETLLALGRLPDARAQAELTLQHLARGAGLPADQCDDPLWATSYSLLRVEWERAAWQHAGDTDAEGIAKAALVRWRLHTILSDHTGDVTHYALAALAQPRLAVSQAALGCALARAERLAEAIVSLRAAVTADPFDLPAGRALYQLLGDTGQRTAQRELARTYARLQQAAPQLVPGMEWFATPTPVGDELASLVILCCNNLDYTQQCVASVVAQTTTPYELILIDNGSTDGTPEYLEAVRAIAGPARVVVVRNETNRGYAAGVNQGLQEAQGTYVVLLNNDVVVTPAWLSGLIAWSLHDYPKVGLVGAVTNATRPPQLVTPDYTNLVDLDGFARRRAEAFRGQALLVERLTGFCLLVRREALSAIGMLDERFGVGFFEDDDLCVRAKQAGFQQLVAQDVYVHHYGSRTFAALGLNTEQLLDENFAKFHAKWGDHEAAGYRRGTPATPTTSVPKVSLFMMVKNEEHHLPDCLQSVRDLVDEMVIVDTGSTDRTKEIATAFGAKVFDFPWIDHFAAARNEGLRHATGDWVFWMDADDRLDEANRTHLRKLFATLPNDNSAYVMKCCCLGSDGSATVVDHVRLFRRRPEHQWTYRVHEQILPALRRTRANVHWADVTITHIGYADANARQRKLERDLRLLSLEVQEQPDDPFTLFNLGSVFHELGQYDDAIAVLTKSLALSHPSDSIVRKLYATLTQLHRQLHRTAEALALCAAGRKHYPDDVELLFVEALLRRETRDDAEAEQCLLRLLDHHEKDHFASVDVGIRSYKARHNLAALYMDTNRFAEAATAWHSVIAAAPTFLPAYKGLGELALRQQDGPQIETLAAQLERVGPQGQIEAVALRARWLMATNQLVAARRTVAQALGHHPRALPLRILHSHAILKEGIDMHAAEASLHAVLELDPANAEARHNLAVLRGGEA